MYKEKLQTLIDVKQTLIKFHVKIRKNVDQIEKEIKCYNEKMLNFEKIRIYEDFSQFDFVIRILCVIDVMKLKMNIVDVNLIIQWKKSFNLWTLMQRIDRTTKNSNRIDEFIWFHSKWCKKKKSIRFNFVVESNQFRIVTNRVTVELNWTRARMSNPRFGQDWTYPSRPSGSNGLGFLSGRITRARTFVRRIESNRHSCSSNAQSEFRLIQKARIEKSILGLIIKFCSTDWTEQAILSESELWASSGVLILGLGFGFCSSDWVGLKKSVRTQPDDHTSHERDRVEK